MNPQNRSKSVGFVVYIKEGKGLKFLLLHHGGTYWNFPKGHIEIGEDEITTATRELAEETGIKKFKIVDGFRQEYNYDFDVKIKNGVKEKVYRTAIFYLAEVDNEKVKISKEHLDFGWFDYATAHKRLFFQQSQNILQSANQFLLKKQDFVL